MRRIISLLLVVGFMSAIVAPVRAGKPVTVWEDPSGDADNEQGLGYSIPGGFDLTSATITRAGNSLEFSVFHADMPPTGSLPETFRFLWAFSVDGKTYRWTVKSVDIGKPDVLQGETTERVGRMDLMGHFRLERECTNVPVGVSIINCPPIAYLDGSFDPATKSFTMTLPMNLVKAKTGSIIGPGGGDSSAVCAATACWVGHIAERSPFPYSVIDRATQTESYKVPKK